MLRPIIAGTYGRGLVSFGMALVTALAVLVPASNANADECTPTPLPNGVVIPCVDDGGEGDGGEDGDDGDSGGGPQTCERFGEEVPCSSEYGAWNGRCYVRNASPQPPAGDPAWEGHESGDGVVLECTPPACAEAGGDLENCPGHSYYWSATPAAPVGPSAEELAERAVASMNLATGAIGSTPPASTSDPDAIGTIGLPIWLWIANRAENTVGPITRSASGGSLTVSATGTLDRVEWALTDGSGTTVGAITCDGANAPGTPYDGRNSAEPSPTCGFGADLNRSPGSLTLTGTAHWSVDWQGGTQEGHIDFTAPSNSTQVQIGELQMLVQD
ncbi:hypothetical protein APR04_004369 [Promicromonospora umidemergens]|uniref:ATP/GTP-binding protein n=2 Tax=Promicromonospora umidemergens TaxID=629679 RepID=A0ABP8XPJ5_9MICO|nr:hypothetical protein [Promicromonospora umidemergens]